jgi:hypothetical protein
MANGTIAFDTLSTSGQISGTAKSVDTDYLAYGSSKAWWSSNDVTLKDSFNIGSLTDVSASTYDFNFTNAMANDDYAYPCATLNTTANDVLLTTGVVTTRVRQKGITSNSGSAVDTQPSGAVIGELA